MYKVRSLWIASLLIAMPLIVNAQGTETSSGSAQPAQGPIEIQADSGEFDNRVNAYKLFGNVRIKHNTLSVTADEGFAYRTPGEDERVELFGQPTEWVMLMEDGSQAKGQSDQIVYNLTNNVIVMIGNARVEDQRGVFTGARLTYNMDTQRTEGEGGVQVVIDPPPKNNP